MTPLPEKIAPLPERDSQDVSPSPLPMGPGAVFVAILTMIFWGGTGVSNLYALDVIPPVMLGGVRFILAAVFMVPWCWLNHAPFLLRRGEWTAGWIMGVLLFLQIGTFNIGSDWSNSSHSSILVNSYIFWVALCESLIFRTIWLNGMQWCGLVIAGIGCSWVFLNTGESAAGTLDIPTIEGDLVLALSGFILAVKILYTKHAVRKIAPETLILWHDVLGSLMFFLTSLLMGEKLAGPMTLPAWMAAVFSGLIVSGYCFGANAVLLRRHGASQVSVFSFGTPIIGVLLGVWMRGDDLSSALLLGGVLVTIGIVLVNRQPASDPVPPHSPEA